MGQEKVNEETQDSCVSLPLIAIVGITVALFTPILGLNFNPRVMTFIISCKTL